MDGANAPDEVAVREEVMGSHAARVADRCHAQLLVHVKRGQVVPPALGVEEADGGDVDLLDRRLVGVGVHVPAGQGVGRRGEAGGQGDAHGEHAKGCLAGTASSDHRRACLHPWRDSSVARSSTPRA